MNTNYPPIKKLTAYLNGELSNEESAEIVAWFRQSDETKKELDHLEIIWSVADRLRQMEKVDKQKARKKIDSRTTPSGKQPNSFIHFFQKVAAILILPVLLFSTYLFFQHQIDGVKEQEFVAAYGLRTALTLPDGSKVWLNSGSKLKYENDFNKDDRTVFLSGEAFFEVAADKSKPFDVVTGQFTVRALGTAFNVFSHKGYGFETSLEEGLTQVFLSGTRNKDRPLIKMKPGQRAVFDEELGQLNLSNVDVSQFSTWREGRLTFINTPMSEVFMKLERWFNVDIDVKDAELLKYRYTAIFENETIQQALEMLSFSSPIEYKIVPGRKQEDDALTKSKIEISIRN